MALYIYTSSTAVPIDGASSIDDTTTTATRKSVYIIRVVNEDLASGPELQQTPQALGPIQQHNNSKHILVLSQDYTATRNDVSTNKQTTSQTESQTNKQSSHDLPKIGLQQCKGRGHTRSQAKTLILLFIMSGVHNE